MEKLSELKGRIADVATDVFAIDWFLLLWLRFDNMDVSKAEGRIRKSVELRQKYQVGPQYSSTGMDEELSKEIPISKILAKDGFSSIILPGSSSFHPKRLSKRYGKDPVYRANLRFLYQIEQDYINSVDAAYTDFELKANLSQNFLFLDDFHGLSIWDHMNPTALDLTLSTAKVIAECFPLFSNNVCIINATKMTGFLTTPGKLFLKKVRVFHEGDESWKNFVSNYTDPEAVDAQMKMVFETHR